MLLFKSASDYSLHAYMDADWGSCIDTPQPPVSTYSSRTLWSAGNPRNNLQSANLLQKFSINPLHL